ncbi:hypothetical protein BsWGS_01823 [Bradybaena similaris]
MDSFHRKNNIRKVPLTFGAGNIRTLLDRVNAQRPERRTALIARELNRYKIDIAALSETRLAGEGQITEDGAGYTFFWSGRTADSLERSDCRQPGEVRLQTAWRGQTADSLERSDCRQPAVVWRFHL